MAKTISLPMLTDLKQQTKKQRYVDTAIHFIHFSSFSSLSSCILLYFDYLLLNYNIYLIIFEYLMVLQVFLCREKWQFSSFLFAIVLCALFWCTFALYNNNNFWDKKRNNSLSSNSLQVKKKRKICKNKWRVLIVFCYDVFWTIDCSLLGTFN